jgi:hypothetical protein
MLTLKSFLGREGVTVLDRLQQKQISGGQSCLFTLTYSDGTTRQVMAGGYSEGSAGSGEANAACVGVMGGDVSRCQYDCAYDGFGQ